MCNCFEYSAAILIIFSLTFSMVQFVFVGVAELHDCLPSRSCKALRGHWQLPRHILFSTYCVWQARGCDKVEGVVVLHVGESPLLLCICTPV